MQETWTGTTTRRLRSSETRLSSSTWTTAEGKNTQLSESLIINPKQPDHLLPAAVCPASFGKHSHDEMSILVPLLQCCRSDSIFSSIKTSDATKKIRSRWWLSSTALTCALTFDLQGQEVHPPASAAAGEGGVQAVGSDGRVHDAGPAGPDSHPASPGCHGPPPAPGQLSVSIASSISTASSLSVISSIRPVSSVGSVNTISSAVLAPLDPLEPLATLGL